MADFQPPPTQSIPETMIALEENLSRLSRKPGVVATVILDKQTGNVLQRSSSATARASFVPSVLSKDKPESTLSSSADDDEFSKMVWKFVNTAGGFVNGLDSEDEVKLLRLRTRKHELVIVPDSKYILIVVHEANSS